jgi:hypothetical protein
VSLAAWCCAGLVTCAAVFAVARAAADEAHWPLVPLLTVWALDPSRPVDASALASTWALALPAASAATGALVLQGSVPGALLWACAVFVAGPSLLTVSIVSVLGQALAAALSAGRPLSLAGRCCLVLLAGDVAALGGPLGDHAAWPLRAERWWIAQWQGALIAAVLVAMHLHARARRA